MSFQCKLGEERERGKKDLTCFAKQAHLQFFIRVAKIKYCLSVLRIIIAAAVPLFSFLQSYQQ